VTDSDFNGEKTLRKKGHPATIPTEKTTRTGRTATLNDRYRVRENQLEVVGKESQHQIRRKNQSHPSTRAT